MNNDKLKRYIREHDDFLSNLLSSAYDTVFILDLEQKFVRIFGSQTDRFSIRAKNILGQKISEVLKESAALHQKYIEQAVNGENVLYEWKVNSGEQSKYFQNSLSPIRDFNGEVIGVIGIERDVTVNGIIGIANRSRFDCIFQDEWKRARRYSKDLAIILCEIDYYSAFKCIYGPMKGDSCLNEVADAIMNTLKRAGDAAAYYGQGRFAIVLPNTNIAGAAHIAELIKNKVEGINISNEASTLGTITVSMGVVSIIPGVSEVLQYEEFLPDTLMKLAKEALQSAKGEGPNSVKVYE